MSVNTGENRIRLLSLTLAAFDKQKYVMDDLAKNLNIKYEGEWTGIKDKVDNVTRTGNLSGFDATGRDFGK